MSKEKLSDVLEKLHDSGDVGMAVHGLAEDAYSLEQRIMELEQQLRNVYLAAYGHPRITATGEEKDHE